MQTKHTAAPWHSTKKEGYFVIHSDESFNCIAACGTGALAFSEQGEANAKLIAAAPMLLDALNEALDQLESWNQESEDTFTMKRVREAINKATL